MRPNPHILVVEDDHEISALIIRFLRANDLRVSAAHSANEMDRILENGRVDLVILDIMLPGEDGFSICRRLRKSSNLPIVMLTAKGDDIDRIMGLEIGADDYLPKPFNPRELLARIRAVLRRSSEGIPRDSKILTFHGWCLDPNTRQLRNPEGARVALTGGEFDLLLAFCLHPRRILSRDQLIDLARGRDAAPAKGTNAIPLFEWSIHAATISCSETIHVAQPSWELFTGNVVERTKPMREARARPWPLLRCAG